MAGLAGALPPSGAPLAAETAAAENAAEAERAANEQMRRTLIEELYRDVPAARAKGNQTCAVIIGNGGVLAATPEAMELSSRSFGGAPGSAEVVTDTGSFSLQIDTPLGFSNAPAGGNDGVTFHASYSGFGVTSFSETPGNIPVRLKNGQTSIQAHLWATRTSSPFPAGQYRAELVLRCE